jgi:bacterioferritin-associated ferredoxin
VVSLLNWKDVPVTRNICYCKNVTKKEIIQAINEGAKSIGDVTAMTGACGGDRCELLNPSRRCCSADVQEMLDYYVPFVAALRRKR